MVLYPQEMLDTEQFMLTAQRNAIRDAKTVFAREWTMRHAIRGLSRKQYLATAVTLRGDINSTNVERARNFEQGSLADRRADFKRRRSAFLHDLQLIWPFSSKHVTPLKPCLPACVVEPF